MSMSEITDKSNFMPKVPLNKSGLQIILQSPHVNSLQTHKIEALESIV